MLHQAGAQVSRQAGNGLSIQGNERLYVGIIANHSGDVIVIAGIAGTIIAEQFSFQAWPGVPIFLKLLNFAFRNATEHRSVHIPCLRILRRINIPGNVEVVIVGANLIDGHQTAEFGHRAIVRHHVDNAFDVRSL